MSDNIPGVCALGLNLNRAHPQLFLFVHSVSLTNATAAGHGLGHHGIRVLVIMFLVSVDVRVVVFLRVLNMNARRR